MVGIVDPYMVINSNIQTILVESEVGLMTNPLLQPGDSP
jgi:hypothetical protein